MNQFDGEDSQLSASQIYINRRQSLVTYSKADLVKFPTRESFGNALVSCFNSTGKVVVLYWACCLEEHEHTSGYHYHASVKLSGPKRWNPVKNSLIDNYGITVHFSSKHENYYSAFTYVCKTDRHVFISTNHPDLQDVGSPVTKKCMSAYQQKCRKRKQIIMQQIENDKQNTTLNEYDEHNTTLNETVNDQSKQNKPTKQKKVRRLTNLDVSEFIVKTEIKNETQLFAKACEQQEAGKKDLANFLLNRSPKAVSDLLATTWKMQNARKVIERNETSRLDVIRITSTNACIPECNGEWLQCALQVLQYNDVHPIVFAVAMRDLLINGRGKFRNILIIGPANCAKTFLLLPLKSIFNTFSNPANDKYAWLGAEKAELIFLNDFRWTSEMIAWKELLLLLEGETVHLPSPKNHYATDITISEKTPIVATSKSVITYIGKYNTTDETENEMMSVRWKVFKFHHRIPQAEQKNVPPCPSCFSKLTLMGEL
jgi:hypothetical protein